MTIPRCAHLVLLAAALLTVPRAIKAGELVIDRSQSHIDIAVKSTVDSFVARLAAFDVTLKIDPTNGRVESGVFQADLAAVKTGRADRDSDMDRWLQTGKYPQVIFELTSVERGPDGALSARGRLQLHGQLRRIAFPVKITAGPGGVTIDGTAALDTREYGLPVIRKFLVLTVDPVVQVRIHLQGKSD